VRRNDLCRDNGAAPVELIVHNSGVDFRIGRYRFSPGSDSLKSNECVLVSVIVFAFWIAAILARLNSRVKWLGGHSCRS
jgi:hypothetical protein